MATRKAPAAKTPVAAAVEDVTERAALDAAVDAALEHQRDEDIALGDMVLTFVRQLVGFTLCSIVALSLAGSFLSYMLLYALLCAAFWLLDTKYGNKLQARFISEAAVERVGRTVRKASSPAEWRAVFRAKKIEAAEA